MNHESSLVSLSIPKEVTGPIVAAKIQEAITAALGGADKIVEAVVHRICNERVDATGKTSQYSSDNKHSWIDYHVTSLLQNQIKAEMQKQLEVSAETIKAELVKQIASKKGSSLIASALLAAFSGTFADSWASKVEVKFETKESASKRRSDW